MFGVFSFPNRKFSYMQIVKQSQHARDMHINNAGYAIVLGWSRNGECIYVRKIGQQSTSCYHYSFWEECNKEEVKQAAKLNQDMMFKHIKKF